MRPAYFVFSVAEYHRGVVNEAQVECDYLLQGFIKKNKCVKALTLEIRQFGSYSIQDKVEVIYNGGKIIFRKGEHFRLQLTQNIVNSALM